MSYKDLAGVSPYFDDFDSTKNFLAILFNPSRAVQARELTQAQTILQNQISSFANHIFKDNSLVLGGTIDHTGDRPYIEVSGYTASTDEQFIADFLGKVISFAGTTAKVTHVVTSPTYALFYTQQSGSNFAPGNVISTADGKTATVDAKGFGTLAFCDNGIIYTKGRFVVINQQDIVVDTGLDGHYHIGYLLEESIVTIGEDATLGDPANGTNNASAPGADRYKIDLVLKSYTEGDVIPNNFIEMLTIKNRRVTKTTAKVQYSDIIDLLARRTYDESGNYSVKEFGVVLSDHPSDEDKMIAEFQPGKAYVLGYEVDKPISESIELDRARTTDVENEASRYIDYGAYVVLEYDTSIGKISTPMNIPFPTHGLLQFHADRDGAGAPIAGASARVAGYKRVGTELRMYLSDYQTSANILKSVKSVAYASDTVRKANLRAVNGVTVFVNTGKPPIIDLEHTFVKSLIESETSYDYSRTYENVSVGALPLVLSDATNVDYYGSEGLLYVYNRSSGKVIDLSTVNVTPNNAPNPSTLTLTFVGGGDNTVSIGNNLDIIVRQRKFQATARTKTLLTATDTIVVNPANTIATTFNLTKEDGVRITQIKQTTNILGGGTEVDVTSEWETTGIFDNGSKDYYYDICKVKGFNNPALVAKMDNPASTTTYQVVYEYFDHSSGTTAKYFTAQSYNLATLDILPTYTTESGGKTYQLINCADFRMKKSEIATQFPEFPYSDSLLNTDIEYYLPRIDKLFIGADGNFGSTTGIASFKPEEPTDRTNAMTLYSLYLPPYTMNTSDVVIKKLENRRYTMRDIGDLERRIGSIEEYTALSLLEKSASEMNVIDAEGFTKFKSGIFVDNFATYEGSNVGSPEYRAVIDNNEGEVRCPFTIQHFDLEHTDESTFAVKNIKNNENTITLPFTTEIYAENPLASGWINVNPLLFHIWNGAVTLNPAIDNWIDVDQAPVITNQITNTQVINTSETVVNNVTAPPRTVVVPAIRTWDGWRDTWLGRRDASFRFRNSVNDRSRIFFDPEFDITDIRSELVVGSPISQAPTVTTTSTSEVKVSQTSTSSIKVDEKIINKSAIPFMRSRSVDFVAKALRPGSSVSGYFDGKPVFSGLTVGVDGSLSGSFTIPTKIPVGTKIFEIKDDEETTFASTSYSASGTLETRQKTITSIRNIVEERRTVVTETRTATPTSIEVRQTGRTTRPRWRDPVAQSFLIEAPGGMFLDSIDVYFRSKDPSIPVSLYIVEMENGIPTSRIVPFSTVVKNAADVVANGSISAGPTNFKFSDPVYLEDATEYAFIVMTSSDKYEVFISTLGQTDIATGRGIARQPYLGSLFKSQNSTTWTADQLSDMKFRIHKCLFSTSAVGTYELRNGNDSNVDATTVCIDIAQLNLPGTSTAWVYKHTLDSSQVNFTLGENVSFDDKRTIVEYAGGVPSFQVIGTLRTNNVNITPVIDKQRRSVVAILNTITGNVAPYNAGTYISKGVNLITPSDDIRVIVEAIKPGNSNIDVWCKIGSHNPIYASKATSGAAISILGLSALDSSILNKVVNVYHWSGGTLTRRGQCTITGYDSLQQKIYFKSATDLGDFTVPTPASQAVVFMEAALDTGTAMGLWNSGTSYSADEVVYYNGKVYQATKASTASTPSNINTDWKILPAITSQGDGYFEDTSGAGWRKMKMLVQPATGVDVMNQFIEYTYVPEVGIDTEFTSFSIKIDLKSQNYGAVPRIKNLRVLAVY